MAVLSKYNSLITIADGLYLHYNALADSFLVSRQGESIYSEENYEEVLREGGFLVERSEDEEELLRTRFYKTIKQNEEFILTINPTLDCNFDCWYCYEQKSHKAYMSGTTLDSVLLFLEKQSVRFQSIHVSFFGGEPFLCFDKIVVPILQKLAALGKTYGCSFTTNAGLLSERMIQILRNHRVSNMQITIDGDRELHNKIRFYRGGNGSYDVILKCITSLLKHDIPVTMRVNYTSETLSSITQISKDLIVLLSSELVGKLKVSLHQVWQTTNIDLSAEVEQVIAHLSSLGFNVSTPVLNNVFSPCYADYEHSAVINYNGDVYKCTAVDFINKPRDGFLSSDRQIVWENESLEKRLDSRFKNAPCQVCRIQPICNGACSQKAIDYDGRDYCVCNFSEEKKDHVIKEKFSAYLRSRQSSL